MFQERILKAGNKKAITEFSEIYVDLEKVVSDYIEQLSWASDISRGRGAANFN